MKLGFGLYYHMLNEQGFAFAKQCGATHITVHLTDYFNQGNHKSPAQGEDNQPVGGHEGWGIAGSNPHVWEYDYLLALKNQLARHGLVLEAIENFDPADWYAILLDLPNKEIQLERLKQIIRNVGKAGIPIFGYNFSIAGVAGRKVKNFLRGNADGVVMKEIDKTPIPQGMVWNMVYDEELISQKIPLAEIKQEELWNRFEWFLKNLIPVAEESGVRLAAHPDDPPAKKIRGQPRLVNRPDLYLRLLNLFPSHSNALELCLGTIQEMPETSGKDIYSWVEDYAKRNAIGYIHFRNVRGKVPNYEETFIDEGDIDMGRILKTLQKYNFEGMLIPDHSPQMACDAPWHAGMAYAMGYMNALMKNIL